MLAGALVNGPSPRVWGKPKKPIELRVSDRTIPTRVGKTYLKAHPETREADHPHACGENAAN